MSQSLPPSESTDSRPTSSLTRTSTLITRFLHRYWRTIAIYYAVILVLVTFFLATDTVQPADVAISTNKLVPRWGGFTQRPLTNKCYRQERTAMLLAMTLGPLGVDQWYAHHWLLAGCKLLLTMLVGLQALLMPKEREGGGVSLAGLSLTLWVTTDVFLWIVGGVYGTPGCPGGNAKTPWLY